MWSKLAPWMIHVGTSAACAAPWWPLLCSNSNSNPHTFRMLDHFGPLSRGGLKWPSTSWEWSNVVQHAKCAMITTTIWAQERPPRSRTSRRYTNMNRSRCKCGQHELRLQVPKWIQDNEELLVLLREKEWFRDFSMMWALRSLCNALQHIRVVQKGPECESWGDYYYCLNTRGAHRVGLGVQ